MSCTCCFSGLPIEEGEKVYVLPIFTQPCGCNTYYVSSFLIDGVCGEYGIIEDVPDTLANISMVSRYNKQLHSRLYDLEVKDNKGDFKDMKDFLDRSRDFKVYSHGKPVLHMVMKRSLVDKAFKLPERVELPDEYIYQDIEDAFAQEKQPPEYLTGFWGNSRSFRILTGEGEGVFSPSFLQTTMMSTLSMEGCSLIDFKEDLFKIVKFVLVMDLYNRTYHPTSYVGVKYVIKEFVDFMETLAEESRRMHKKNSQTI